MACDPNSADYYLSKFTILYGTSGVGKTTVIRHIIKLLANKLTIVHIFSGSDDSGNSNFSDISPVNIISSEISTTRLDAIYNKQVPHAKKYSDIKNITLMKGLSKLIASPTQQAKIKELSRGFKAIAGQSADIVTRASTMMLKYYHDLILRCNTASISEKLVTEITSTQKLIRRYREPPCMAIIIDDCSDRKGDWAKSPIIKTLAYKARHYHITTILADQGQSLETDVRIGAHNHIFMNMDSLRRTFALTASGLKLTKSENSLVEQLFAEAAAIAAGSNRQQFATVARCKVGANIQYGLIKYPLVTVFADWVLSDNLKQLFHRPDKQQLLQQFLNRVAKK
jgi:hypothetical protein